MMMIRSDYDDHDDDDYLSIVVQPSPTLTCSSPISVRLQALISAVFLAKAFHAKLWESSPYVTRQLDRIGAVLSGVLVRNGVTSFQALRESNARDLEVMLGRQPPFGEG